ncbi:NAD(P)H-dependent oxidoreductase subunit E [Arenibaculum pallidiluteum]|uniref:NAD(P)H-dependent oxidoreductase subunit E n=1 Tax=Arenibaculum pallidiluteum TaxID=2812559 RepID=UPI001A95E0C3|nr:NAD(P)H-dependent oxidoreductase subunit E [Arenibaculum pallidiluteum]
MSEPLEAQRPTTRRKASGKPKGRQIDPGALEEVQALLGDAPRRRDLLIEHLHALQDRFGCLHHRHLAALAAEMRLAQAEVFEVATFYAHFDIVPEGEAPPPPVTLRVCDGIACSLRGAHALLDRLPGELGPEVRVVPAPCMGACNRGPVAMLGQRLVAPAEPAAVAALIEADETHPVLPDVSRSLEDYRADGGYAVLEDCLAGRRTRDEVVAALSQAGLRGLGGAGFPIGRKWDLVRHEPGPRLMAVNGDEGEPGTFKDRYLLETDPHRVLEGILIGAWAVEATDVYIYLRDEYPESRALLAREIPILQDAALAPHVRIHLRRGAGAYICGEETAMLESIEGKRGLPRHKPPFAAQVGLFRRPTLINNVETLSWVPQVLARGMDWWTSHGRHGRRGLRCFSVSGRVREPGVKIAPAGITIRELISEFCGGMAEGHQFRAYLPGGASGGILPASMADLPLDFGVLEPHGCFIGSAAVVVLSDKDDLRGVALNLLRFFEDESCGQCTPCRVGTSKAVDLLSRPDWDVELLGELAAVMTDASICGLGQAAMNPVLSILRHFPKEVR